MSYGRYGRTHPDAVGGRLPQPKVTSISFTVTYADGTVVSYCVAAPEAVKIAADYADDVLADVYASPDALALALRRETVLKLAVTPGPTGFRAWISPVPDDMTGEATWRQR